MTNNTQIALENLIKAHLSERGCSRLNAAGYAVGAALDEYNAIQKRLGCKNTCVIVDSGQVTSFEERNK